MQKIGQLQTYVEVKETAKPVFLHPEGSEDQARLIKMRMLAEQGVNVYVEPLDADEETGEVDEIRFLAHIAPGMEQLEFHFRGSFALLVKGGSIWLDTYDNTSFNVESLDPVSFSRLWEREERDPRILEIERQARHNQNLLMQQMEADRAVFREEMAAIQQEARRNVNTSASPSDTSKAGQPAASTGLSSADDQQPNTPPAGGTSEQS